MKMPPVYMKKASSKIVARVTVLFAVLSLVVVAGYMRSNAVGITFATQGIDLKIDSKATYNGVYVPSGTWNLKNLVPGVDRFFNFNDIKPGDHGENTISMHVKNDSAWLCVDFKNLLQSENGVNEPESLVDANGSTTGELAAGMEFFSWVDDGDNIFELGERPLFGTTTQSASVVLNNKSYAIGDTKNGSYCGVNQTRYVGIYWCAGNLSVNLATAAISCDGAALGNAAQTDSMSVDVSIRALPSKENPKFLCGNPGTGTTSPDTGKISGTVYNDLNKSHSKNSGEPGLAGWKINLYDHPGWSGPGNSAPIKSSISDANGNYSFTTLIDGTYSVEEINQNGWEQLTSDYSPVVVSGGAVISGKDFGNAQKKPGKKW